MSRSVLVVDDAAAVAASAAHALEAAGHHVRVALSVDAAFAELLHAPPDVVVLDHALDRDAALLRHALVARRLPVLLVSGLDDDVALDVAGAHQWHFLPKPFDDEQLTAAVAALLTPETPSMSDTRPSPDPRPSLAPDLPPAPATIAPREAPLPAPPPAAQLTPSGRPTATPAVQIVDHISDMVGMIILGLLCHSGKIGGTETLLAIGAILGLGTGLRQIGGRLGGAGVGVAGLAVLGVSRWLAPAAGAAELARASGVFGLLAVLAVGGGCSGGPLVQSPGAVLALRVAWPSIHKGAVNGGLCQDDPPEWLVGPSLKDGGAAQPPAPVQPSPAAEGDASAPGPADAAATGGDQ